MDKNIEAKEIIKKYEESGAFRLYQGSKIVRSKMAYIKFCEELKRRDCILLTPYKNSSKDKVLIKCSKNHFYKVLVGSFMQGHECPYCTGHSPDKAKLDFYRILRESNYNLIGKYINSNTKVKVQCPQGHIYEVQPANFKHGTRCPICNGSSIPEKITMRILDHYKIPYIKNKRFKGLFGIGGRHLSYDFFINENTLVEIHGALHFKSMEYFGGSRRLVIQEEHDKRKRDFAKNNGIRLIEISYMSPRDKDKIKDIILKEFVNNDSKGVI